MTNTITQTIQDWRNRFWKICSFFVNIAGKMQRWGRNLERKPYLILAFTSTGIELLKVESRHLKDESKAIVFQQKRGDQLELPVR